jgi:CDP-glycerol glycerophosphotransferase (TagB/SpsB family)
MDEPLFAGEREQIFALAKKYPHVHVVEPVPLGGELGHYSGEDMPEKTSMMAYSDVFLTVYSTMVVEAAVHGTPIVSVCFDAPGGWNTPGKFSLALSKIGDWPTHQRFRLANAGKVAFQENQLLEAINAYLQNPKLDAEARAKFIQDEITYTDGSAGQHTAEFFLKLLEK